MSNTAFYQRTSFLYFFAVAASVLISIWVNARELVINPDAICYLYSAEQFGKSGFHDAMHLCPQAIWPFYSILLFAADKLLHLPLTTTAFIIDGAFSALSVAMFIAIVQALGASRRIMWLAALVILLSHQFNILRQEIIRDHGFWAFYLMSLFLLLHYFRQPNWLRACAWSASLLVATIFRIEGAIFLLLLPFVSFFTGDAWRQRVLHFCRLNFPLLLIAMMAAGWLSMHPQQTVAQLGRVAEVGHQLQNGLRIIFEQYQLTKTSVAENLLSHNSLRDASLVVVLLLVSWYLVNVVNNLSWIYSILVLYAWFTRAAQWSRQGLIVVMGYALINLTVTFGFFAQNHFLAKRYLIAFSLVLMLWVPFGLERLFNTRLIKQRVYTWVIILFIFISAVGGLFHFGHSKDYIRHAGDWLAENVPADAKIYSNDYQLMYYSQHFGSAIFQKQREYNDVSMIAHGHWKQYDYLALLMGREQGDKTATVMQEIHIAPLQVFVSDSGDHIYIYKILHQERAS